MIPTATRMRVPFERLRAHAAAKACLTVALPVLLGALYFTLQRFPLFPARTLSLSALDRQVPFDPGWTAVYQSLYLLLPVVPWLAIRREELRRYAIGLLLLSAAAFLFFLVLPIEGPRPLVERAGGLYGLLVRYDAPANAFPSQHAGMAIYTLLCAGRLFWGVSRPWNGFVAALAAWILLILYSTLATKQHFAIDLAAGGALAWVAYRWAWRDDEPKRRRIDEATE